MKHLTPLESYAFLQANSSAVLIDVRMEIEFMYVGYPVGAINIPWYEYPDFTPKPEEFVNAVLKVVENDKNRPVLLICRSARRTITAGETLANAGFSNLINILHGFEGDLDDALHRSTVNGWRYDGLPWQQM